MYCVRIFNKRKHSFSIGMEEKWHLRSCQFTRFEGSYHVTRHNLPVVLSFKTRNYNHKIRAKVMEFGPGNRSRQFCARQQITVTLYPANKCHLACKVYGCSELK